MSSILIWLFSYISILMRSFYTYLILVTTVTTGGSVPFSSRRTFFQQRTQNGLLLGKFIQRLKTQIYTFFVMKILDAPSQILNVINTTSQRRRHQLRQKNVNKMTRCTTR